MTRYDDDYFEEDMINAAEMAAHQPQDDDTTEYATGGIVAEETASREEVSERLGAWYGMSIETAHSIAAAPDDQIDPDDIKSDPVNHPRHYGGFSNGAEVIDITENLTFAGGNAVKYVSRACRVDGRNKGNVREDIEKAIWYLNRELERLGDSDA